MLITVLEKTGERTEEYEEFIPAKFDEETGEVLEEAHVVLRQKVIPIIEEVTRQANTEEEKLYAMPNQDTRTYGEKVNDLIRSKYSLSEELAILRQRDTKPAEFAEYNSFVENCKIKAK